MKPRKLMLLVGVLPLTMVAQSAVAASSGPFTGTPDPVDFGQVVVGSGPTGGQTVTITVDNTAPQTINSIGISGADQGQFGTTNDTCSGTTLSNPGDSCTVDVTFDPGSTGTKNAQLDVSYGGGSAPGATSLTGVGITYGVSAGPDPTDFGTQAVTDPASTQQVTVQNTGNANLTVVDATVPTQTAGAGFSAGTGCNNATLAPNGTCTINVTFQPTTAGAKTGTLQITTNHTGPQNVSLTGNATAPGVSVPASVDFGNVLLNSTATRTVTVTNSGTSALHVTSVSFFIGNPPFAVVSGTNGCAGATLQPTTSCSLQISYHPTSTIPAAGTLRVVDDAANSPQDIPVTGTSLSKFVDISPAIHGFGTLTVGKLGSPVPYILTNKDVAPLSLGANPIRISGRNSHSFVVTANTCVNRVLAANGTCAFNVRFSPGSAGPLSGVVRELDSAPDSPHGAALTGAAVLPPNATNLHGSAGCTAITMLWTPSGTAGAVGSWITRNAHHVPRSPGDGTRLARTRPGVLLNGRLAEFHTYYYAIWTLYRFQAGHPVVFSARKAIALHTGRMCQPQNGATIRSHTPLLRWLPRRGAFAYGLRIYDRGVNIFAWSKRTTTPRYQVKSSWVFRGTRRSLHSGHTYTVFIYAYTRNLPRGFQIGKSAFHVR